MPEQTFVPIAIPSGVVRTASPYGARGRWFDTNLVRWPAPGVLATIGGWAQIIAAASLGSDPVRGMFAWRRNDNRALLALGTHDAAYLYQVDASFPFTPALTTITPAAAFTAGQASETGGVYHRIEVGSWQFDNFGEDLLAAHSNNNQIYVYDTSAGGVLTAISGVTGTAVLVTPERYAVALGETANPRRAVWSAQDDAAEWDYTDPLTGAGFVDIPTRGKLLAGRRSRSESLIWTDVDVWAMRYIGGDLIYGFQQVGDYCGTASRRAMVVFDGKAAWMGHDKFFIYDGFTREIPCPLKDFIFGPQELAQAASPVGSGFALQQPSKVAAVLNSKYNEVWWFYPSHGSNGLNTENDRYVAWNYETGDWHMGVLPRSDGVDSGVFGPRPIWGAPAGVVYEHESRSPLGGFTDTGIASYTPYAESGPVIEVGEGERVMLVRGFIPDEETLGEAVISLKHSFYPLSTETTTALGTLANPTDVLVTARQIRIRVEYSSGAHFRFGRPRLEVVPGGYR